VELLDAEAHACAKVTSGTVVFYRMLDRMGVFGDHAPAALRQLHVTGQRTPEELVDRYRHWSVVRSVTCWWTICRSASPQYEEINRCKAKRHRKVRMDACTRERLRVPPVLVRTIDQAAHDGRGLATDLAWGRLHRGRSDPGSVGPATRRQAAGGCRAAIRRRRCGPRVHHAAGAGRSWRSA
jgi:hypothetical protein